MRIYGNLHILDGNTVLCKTLLQGFEITLQNLPRLFDQWDCPRVPGLGRVCPHRHEGLVGLDIPPAYIEQSDLSAARTISTL